MWFATYCRQGRNGGIVTKKTLIRGDFWQAELPKSRRSDRFFAVLWRIKDRRSIYLAAKTHNKLRENENKRGVFVHLPKTK